MIGRKLRNRYEVQDHLGDGSTATVYRALDTKLGRSVALKVLLPHVRETTRKRFFQEATAAAQLNHPNIMSIYDVDEDDAQPFLVVEYVDGVTLTNYIPTSAENVVQLGAQIAFALQYAHEREIIHRDIKPANIKVTPEGRIKIMDLGLALPREAKRVTAHGMVIGTPAYLSPEQAQGHPLDARTDIYSLGIVLYEMACGELPFNADDISALLLQQVKQAPPSLRGRAPNVPIRLEAVIVKALEKNPAHRFQNAKAFGDALLAAAQPINDDEIITRDNLPKTDRLRDPSNTTGMMARNNTPTLRVILADDHTILRKTLANFLEARPDFVIVGEAADGEAALSQTLAILPDVLVLDLNMPIKGGLDVLPIIRSKAPSVKVLILTGRDEDAYIVRALRSGANGYVLKTADENEFADSIQRVAQGQLVLGRGVAEKIVSGLLTGEGNKDKQLDDNERRVMLYVAAGYENDQIVRALKIPNTVLTETLARALTKLRAKDRVAAALQALRLGHILLDELQTVPPPPQV